MEKEIVYYLDRSNKKLINKRKKDLKFNYVVIIAILAAYSFVCMSALSQLLKDDRFIFFFLLWIGTLIGGFFVLRYIFIMDEEAAISYGISLTPDVLKIYRYEYPLSSILYSEVVDFLGSGGLRGSDRFMALVYLKNGRMKIRLLRSDETEDVLKLSNLIRKLKGLPEQREIEKYGMYRGYREWKKEVLKKAAETLK